MHPLEMLKRPVAEPKMSSISHNRALFCLTIITGKFEKLKTVTKKMTLAKKYANNKKSTILVQLA